ncbi:MAG: FAD-dependent oxidoreductase [Thermoleophilia bacterium]|nr:FAD-dependent oxidoreductase [Thermoleophilia bacterium]
MSAEKLVIVGGDAAAMSAASQARRGRADLGIVAFEKGRYVSYAACGIPYYVGGLIDSFDKLLIRTPEEFQRKQNIEARVLQEVIHILPAEAKVVVRDLESSEEYEEPYDHLLIATGAKAVWPALPGIDSQDVFGVTSLDDAKALRERLERERPKHVVIVGGGYIGLEMAEAFMRWGVDVSIVGRAPELLRTIDADMGALVSEALAKAGVHLYLGEAATAFEGKAGRVSAVVTEERTLPADLVVIGAGFRPNSDLAREAGLPLGFKDAIKVDDHMRTTVERVWAAGDCVETVQLVTGRSYWVSVATVASKQGRVAGTNIAGGDASFRGTFGTMITKAGPVEIARIGLSEADLSDGEIPFTSVKIDTRTCAPYHPASEPMSLKLTAERGTGRLLGGQIVGGAGAAMRINVLASALQAHMTVDQMAELDLAYAPPFSSVWDPVLLAARDLCAEC